MKPVDPLNRPLRLDTLVEGQLANLSSKHAKRTTTSDPGSVTALKSALFFEDSPLPFEEPLLVSNWAYMVMASLAWTLKAWFALLLPEVERWRARYLAEKRSVMKMEFKTFLNAF